VESARLRPARREPAGCHADLAVILRPASRVVARQRLSVAPLPIVRETMIELNRIGGSFNQLARLATTTTLAALRFESMTRAVSGRGHGFHMDAAFVLP